MNTAFCQRWLNCYSMGGAGGGMHGKKKEQTNIPSIIPLRKTGGLYPFREAHTQRIDINDVSTERK